MRPVGKLALCGLALAAGSVAAMAQSAVISARSGLIHYVDGQVYVAGQEVESKFGTFPEVKENQELRTEEGRAEVLLTPGVFLRVGENSAFRMITNRLIDTRLEFLSGSAIVEAQDLQKDNSVTIVYRDTTIHVRKKGIYRLDSSPAALRVFDGSVDVASWDQNIEVKEGRLLELDTLAMHKFDKTETDALNRWSERRAEYVSMANVSAANSLRTSMLGGDYMYGGNAMYGGNMFMGGWFFNPFFGMYTYVPGMGMGYSPYGYAFWSPFSVYQAYMPGYYYYPTSYGYGSGGNRTGRSGGYSGAYNNAGYRSVPAPTRAGSGGGIVGSGGSIASGHGATRGASSGSTGSVSAGGRGSSGSSGAVSAPISHGGGVANSPHR